MLFTFAAMLAIVVQAFVVQTHIHTIGTASPSAYVHLASGDGSDAPTAHVSAPDDAQGCIICQALAANGGAALPDTAHVAAVTNASYETAALEIRRAPRAITHSWQSRAPPIAA